MATPDMDVIKEIPGYKVILKAVLKSQIQQLVEQLATTTEEESVILTASVADGTLCHLGSDSGKVFLEDHEDIKSQFLGFCLKRHHKKNQEKERQEALEREEAIARLMPPVTPPSYGGPRPGFMPQRSPRHLSPQRGLHPVALSRVSPGARMRAPGARHQPYPMTRPPRVPMNFEQQGPKPGNKMDGQVIKIEPDDDDDEKLNQNVSDSANVQTPSSAHDSSEPSSPSVKPSTPSQSQGPSASDNDDAKSESSTSTIPNEAADLKFTDTAPPEGLSLDSDLSNIISASTPGTDSSVPQESTGEPQTSSDIDPNVSVKLEAVSESEMDLEITGVELGQGPVQEPMSSQEWMSSVQSVMQGASGSAADMAGQQGYIGMEIGLSRALEHSIFGKSSSGMKRFTKRVKKKGDDFQSLTTHISDIAERYRCNICNKVNGSRLALERHLLTHTGERSHVCRYCNKAFTICSSLYRHIRALHDPAFVPK